MVSTNRVIRLGQLLLPVPVVSLVVDAHYILRAQEDDTFDNPSRLTPPKRSTASGGQNSARGAQNSGGTQNPGGGTGNPGNGVKPTPTEQVGTPPTDLTPPTDDTPPQRWMPPTGQTVVTRNQSFVWLFAAWMLFSFSIMFLHSASKYRSLAFSSKTQSPTHQSATHGGEPSNSANAIGEFLQMATSDPRPLLWRFLVPIALLWFVRTIVIISPPDFMSFIRYSIEYPEIYTAPIGLCATLPSAVALLQLVQAHSLTSLLDERHRDTSNRFIIPAFVIGTITFVASVVTILSAYWQATSRR